MSGVIDILQDRFAAMAADALAVLSINLPAPAAEGAGVVGGVTAQAENAAIIIDLLAVVGVVGDAGRADEVDARPTRRPDIGVVAGAVEITGIAEVPELAETILICLAPVEQEFAERFDIVAKFVRTFGIGGDQRRFGDDRSEEHTSELQSLMRNSYAVFCLKKKKTKQ